MDDYRKYISPIRQSVATPDDLVDENGICSFGTFQSEFPAMNLLQAKKPTHAPQCMNRLKLTQWQATEVFLHDGILLAVVCDMGLFGKIFHLYYDKKTKKCHCWDTNLNSSDTMIAPNLLDQHVSEAHTSKGFVRYENDLGHGKYHLSGSHHDKDGFELSYDFTLRRISKPSIVSIPFGPNRPLYSQKDFLRAQGSLTLNGSTIQTDLNSVAVLDDHRGFYPRHAHYDWVTTMGHNEISGESQLFALNLTHNQSTDPDAYNENLIWMENRTSLLPPVTFTREPSCKEFHDYAEWRIQDEHDMVNLSFSVYALSPMILHAGIISIDYYIAFGTLSGYVRDEDGTRYLLDQMPAMGEDKTLLL